jgi:hypothetical protein
MAQKRKSRGGGDLFIEEFGQLRLVDKSAEQLALEGGKVECLGLSFGSEDARRAHFTEKLREKLADPEFRATPDFPKGSDDEIIRMSDPPWYTACPNPFLADFVRVYGKTYDPQERYDREPFAVDTSVGKTDALYMAHSYHTKVPHLAIVPSILHYTEPGDVVLDGFAGSGMTGVAAQWCGSAPMNYRKQLESQWSEDGRSKPTWGPRRSILNDLGPAATFIASNNTLPFDVNAFAKDARRLLLELDNECGWMYETIHHDLLTKGRINYTVWSEIFSCPECASEVNFVAEALDKSTQRVREIFPCPHCRAELTKKQLGRLYVLRVDENTGEEVRAPKRAPVLINYTVGTKTYNKEPDEHDLKLIDKISSLKLPSAVPLQKLPYMHMTHERARMDNAGITHLHHFFLHRAAYVLGVLWEKADKTTDRRCRNILIYLVEQAIQTMSLQNRFQPQGFKQVNKYLPGVYYIPSHTCEVSPWYAIASRSIRIAKTFAAARWKAGFTMVSTSDCAEMQIPENTVDYIFTDPPFGENIYYADMNYIIESWHRVFTNAGTEAIIDKAKKKTLSEYQRLMQACFERYAYVLKPGRWMTVVFSNSSNAVWRSIQEALGVAGFVVADVRTLDKQLGSYRQVTSSAVKQDLVISAYKPNKRLVERFALGTSSPENAWAFVTEHLGHVPVFSSVEGAADVITERTTQVLHDRMVAFHVQRQLPVPLSTAEFLVGLTQRYPERDGMYFLPAQVAEYDRKRNAASELRQLSLFVTDEASAIQWVRQELRDKPRSFQELQPAFMREIQNWAKHEETVELKEILRQNCIQYDGSGPVPGQIHSYLSSNFKDLRNLAKDDPALVAKAVERWYVPDPSKQIDLEKLREKSLLNEFEAYKQSKERKLKLFRTEAVRVGFKAAYDGQDYKTIVSVAAKLPENVMQEDEKLLMYYDVASMRLGHE